MEKVRVGMPSYVVGFWEHFNQPPVRGEWTLRKEFMHHIDALAPKINFQDLGEWTLRFDIIVRGIEADFIGFCKRALRYPSNREFIITGIVPIPTEEQAPYGFGRKEPFYKPIDPSNSYTLPPDFGDYDNLYDYVLASGKKVIDLAFSKGFTCNGKRIKLQS